MSTNTPASRTVQVDSEGSAAQTAKAAKDHAKMLISPEISSFRVITKRERSELMDQLDTLSLMEALRDQTKEVQKGDLRVVEAMLISQATALQSLFVQMAERSMGASLLPQQEMGMRFALKAQAQCRATLETLAAIKNPPIVYAKQANIAHGPQQVNNGVVAEQSARTRETKTEISPNKLLEEPNNGGTHMDIGAATTPARRNPAVATVEAVNRPVKPRRKSSGGS